MKDNLKPDSKVVEVMFSNSTFIEVLASTVVRMEVGSHADALSAEPYLPHGLLQTNTKALRAYGRDTSYGWFGFTHDTTAENIDFLRALPETTGLQVGKFAESFRRKVKAESNYNIPAKQALLFFAYVMRYHDSFERFTVKSKTLRPQWRSNIDGFIAHLSGNPSWKRLVVEELIPNLAAKGSKHGSYDSITSSAALAVCQFYQIYNGVVSTPSRIESFKGIIDRLNRSFVATLSSKGS